MKFLQKEKPENIFLVLAILFMGISMFLFPINRVPDEMSHARMSWGILYANTDESFTWMDSVSKDYPIDRDEYRELFTKKIDLSNETIQVNLPLKRIVQIPQLIGMVLGQFIYPSIGVIVSLGRLMNGIVYILGIYLIIKKSRFGKWPVLFISLLPIMVQQASSLSYDVVNYLVIVGFFGFLTCLVEDNILTKKRILQILLFTFALFISKKNNILLVPLLLTIPLRLPNHYVKINRRLEGISRFVFEYRYWILASLGILGIGGILFLLNYSESFYELYHVMINTLINNQKNGQLNTILTIGMFGYLGNFSIQLPLWLIFINVGLLAFLFSLQTNIKTSKLFGFTSASMVFLQIAVIIAGMYYAWTPIVLGEHAEISVGAQGRYFTPFLVFLTPFFLSLSDKLVVQFDEKSLRMTTVGLLVINFIFMFYLVNLTYWKI